MISSYMNQILQRNRTSRNLFVSLSVHPSIERFLRNCFTLLWGLVSLKSMGQASSLEIQAEVDVSILSLNLAWWEVEKPGRVSVLQCGGKIPSLNLRKMS